MSKLLIGLYSFNSRKMGVCAGVSLSVDSENSRDLELSIRQLCTTKDRTEALSEQVIGAIHIDQFMGEDIELNPDSPMRI